MRLSTFRVYRSRPHPQAAVIYNEPRGGGDSGRMEDQPHATALTKNEIIFVGTLVYPVADPAGATLTVREREADPRVTPSGLRCRGLRLAETGRV